MSKGTKLLLLLAAGWVPDRKEWLEREGEIVWLIISAS